MSVIKDTQAERNPGRPSSRAVAKAIRHERDQERQIRRIVCLLMDVMAIPDGNQYGAYFGDSGETDNREALTTWIRKIFAGNRCQPDGGTTPGPARPAQAPFIRGQVRRSKASNLKTGNDQHDNASITPAKASPARR